MYLRIRHATTYSYAGPVQFGPHRLMLRPRDSFDLRVVDTARRLWQLRRDREFRRCRQQARHRQ
jgi:hypothetical protein